MLLNLDQLFKPFGSKNELSFESQTFSGGEPQIRILSKNLAAQQITVTCRINSFNDFGLLLIAIDALKRMQVGAIKLFIPYFPAARQDRLMIEGEALTVKVYAEIINSLCLDEVTVFDPHSEVTPALLNNCTALPNYQFIKKVISDLGSNNVLISPDGGALKKAYKLSQALGGIEVIECSKSRDVKTGQLSDFKVYYEDLEGKGCLIVDDICDGGGTFLGLANALIEKGAGKLVLAVSHGIFSQGFGQLLQHYDAIYCTDSIKNFANNKVNQINFNSILK